MKALELLCIGLLVFFISSRLPHVQSLRLPEMATQPTQTPVARTVSAPSQPATDAQISRNWSGYAAGVGSYTGVTGTWTIPQADDTGNPGVDATWVGIGGINSPDLIQAGTQQIVSPNGRTLYQAFFETLPQPARPLEMTVQPGDSITVALKQSAGNQWDVTIKNNTTGDHLQFTQEYDSTLSSAEWIEEAPSSPQRVLPLDNFGSVQFTNATTVKDDRNVTIAQSGAQPITMGIEGQTLATASVLNSDGKSFQVNRTDTTAEAPEGGNKYFIITRRQMNAYRYYKRHNSDY